MNIKESIINKINDKIRLLPKSFNFKELCAIYNKTNFLKYNTKINERCYCILHNINSQPICKNCNKPVKFLRLCNGYREYCSNSCKNKFIIANTDIKSKISKSVLNYHKNVSFKERKNQQNKRLKTMINKGLITSFDNLKDWQKYRKLVLKFTNEQNLKELENYNLRGKNFHLDHIYSIFQGFKENIPAHIIGNIVNLRIISAHENASKKEKCAIDKNELFKLFVERSETIPSGSTLQANGNGKINH